MRDFYRTLGVKMDESMDVISSKIAQSNISPNEKEAAYSILSDPKKREIYNRNTRVLRRVGWLRSSIQLKDTPHWNKDKYSDFIYHITSKFLLKKILGFISALVLAFAYSRLGILIIIVSIIGTCNLITDYFDEGKKSSSTSTINEKPAFNIPEITFPKHGIYMSSLTNGTAPLSIVTKKNDYKYFLKIENIADPEKMALICIHSGLQIQIKIPLGLYKIKYASGRKWYGITYLFGTETTYSAVEKVFAFSSNEYQTSGYTIELIQQSDGNLRTKRISPDDF